MIQVMGRPGLRQSSDTSWGTCYKSDQATGDHQSMTATDLFVGPPQQVVDLGLLCPNGHVYLLVNCCQSLQTLFLSFGRRKKVHPENDLILPSSCGRE